MTKGVSKSYLCTGDATPNALNIHYMEATVNIRKQDRRVFDGRTVGEHLRDMELLGSVGIYEVDLAEQLDEPVPVVTLDGQVICSEGNLSAIVGEAKSKKTFLCSALVGGVLSSGGCLGFDAQRVDVLWIDTEQSEAHVHRVVRRTHRLAGLDCDSNSPRLHVLALRELDPALRAQTAFDAIELYRPGLVVIDGISDLQYNTNDLEESERIVTSLMRLSSQYHTHILCVLHTNPGSDKARGHTGSALQRKAETVMYVHRVGAISAVEPQFCRNEPFERFAFRVNDEGLPELCDLPAQEEQNPCIDLLRNEFGGAVERAVLISRMAQAEGIPHVTARVRVTRAIKRGQLTLSDDGREVSIPW